MMRIKLLLGLLCTIFYLPAVAESPLQQQKTRLLHEIQQMGRHAQSFLTAGFQPKVLAALRRVPRERFVPHSLYTKAYLNRPLPIGYGQTISQPYIVALMTQLLHPKKTDKVLEIGTGSGYQAAVLAKLTRHVYSIEIIRKLAQSAKNRLHSLGFHNITVTFGDGYFGLKKQAPFNKIIVTAAANHIPRHLIQQLANNGIMIIPIGEPFSIQHLILIKKNRAGKISTQQLMAVRFVPFKRRHD